MLEQKEHFHGSDLEKIEKVYNIKKEDIISFSANVNPLGVSPLLRKTLADKIDVITSYPDREYTSLRQSIASYCMCEADDILVGNGCTELISLFIQITAPKKTLLLGPTYSEYERDLKLQGSEIDYYMLNENDNFRLDVDDFKSNITTDTDLIIICNPNNPTGGCVSRENLSTLLSHCKETNTYMMIDETYVEFAENINEISAIPLCKEYDNLMVLRGTSKFFAAPGLRLGYAITGNKNLLNDINSNKNPWMINSLAVVAGETMFMDTEYILATRKLMTKERSRLTRIFEESGKFKVYPSNSNFLLLKILDSSVSSHDLFEKAIRENMMIRDCSTFPGFGDRFIRLCFMQKEDNDRLVACLLS